MTESDLFSAMEARTGLHTACELVYLVDGYEWKVSQDDGNTWQEFEGESIRDAIQAWVDQTPPHPRKHRQ